MNFRVDVIIIGDSTSGHSLLDKIASSNSSIKIAFISSEFKSTTKHEHVNVKHFKDAVEYISYRHRLFCCYLKNGDNVFGTHVIAAPGLKYEPLVLNDNKVLTVRNSIDDVQKTAKDQNALVVGDNDIDIKLAIDVAKKFKHVYMCTKAVDINENLSAQTAKKLDKTENISVITNASIKKVVCEQEVKHVELDNYTEIDCSAIFAKTNSKPAIEFIPKKILSVENGYPLTTDSCESTMIPKFFVTGSCLEKYTKAMEQAIIDSVLKDFSYGGNHVNTRTKE